MAKQLIANSGVVPLRTLGGNTQLIGVTFTTDGSGVATLLDSYGGILSIAKSSNTYTITFGPVLRVQAYSVDHNQHKGIDCAVTTSASAGTIALAFDAAFASGECSVMLLVVS